MDRSTLRRIQTKTDISFSAKWKQAQKYADHIPEPLQNLKKHISKSTKILQLDGKHVNVLGRSVCIYVAYDTGIGVIDYFIDDTENKTAYGYILRRLREHGYEPICGVSDGHSGIECLLREENIPNQLCVFHLLQTLRRMLSRQTFFSSEIPQEHKVLYSRIKGIFKTSKIEDIPARIDNFRKLQRFWHLPVQKKVIKWFWQNLPNAIIGLSFKGNIPNTNNLLENLNGQIEARLKTFRGVKSEQSLSKILKILFYLRNFK